MTTFASAVEHRQQVGGPVSGADIVVYLAGPMAGLVPGEASSWRRTVETELARSAPQIRCLDPMRGRPTVAARERGLPEPLPVDVVSGRAIVTRDFSDVRRADVVLMNLAEAREVSVGTMVELGWASALNKFVIVVAARDDELDAHDHLFVRELASIRVECLADAIEVLRSF